MCLKITLLTFNPLSDFSLVPERSATCVLTQKTLSRVSQQQPPLLQPRDCFVTISRITVFEVSSLRKSPSFNCHVRDVSAAVSCTYHHHHLQYTDRWSLCPRFCSRPTNQCLIASGEVNGTCLLEAIFKKIFATYTIGVLVGLFPT